VVRPGWVEDDFHHRITRSFCQPQRLPESRSTNQERDQTFRFGIITCDPNRRILSVVKNILATGALIEVDNAIEIPDEFTLAIESELSARICRVHEGRPSRLR
jgi:hypothetical protein